MRTGICVGCGHGVLDGRETSLPPYLTLTLTITHIHSLKRTYEKAQETCVGSVEGSKTAHEHEVSVDDAFHVIPGPMTIRPIIFNPFLETC